MSQLGIKLVNWLNGYGKTARSSFLHPGAREYFDHKSKTLKDIDKELEKAIVFMESRFVMLYDTKGIDEEGGSFIVYEAKVSFERIKSNIVDYIKVYALLQDEIGLDEIELSYNINSEKDIDSARLFGEIQSDLSLREFAEVALMHIIQSKFYLNSRKKRKRELERISQSTKHNREMQKVLDRNTDINSGKSLADYKKDYQRIVENFYQNRQYSFGKK